MCSETHHAWHHLTNRRSRRHDRGRPGATRIARILRTALATHRVLAVDFRYPPCFAFAACSRTSR
ncbi:hypothetical protein [Paraburkholderia saeva]|uniref:hypothetical protein n=1 Tax=Paraburkholderia saeva TaxID=2777537 RepID=UPI001E486A2C|nr:hypothetical protein [Paraburkholderia saeva]